MQRLLRRALLLLWLATLAACGGGEGAADEPLSSEAEAPVRDAVAPPDGARETIEARIAAALAAGAIDRETALAYRVFALFGDARLPASLRGRGDGNADAIDEVDGNAVLDELRAAWDTLSDGTRRVLAPFRARPSAAGGQRSPSAARELAAAVRPACAVDATWDYIAPATALVRVWYDKTRPADLTQAQATAAALDTLIWPTLITTLGFEPPLSDTPVACNGGDGRLDIYIVASLGSRGVTDAESASVYQSSTFILLRSGLAGAALQYAATHQFMHAIQWAYLMAAPQTSYGWMRNALANWAVEAVYPGNTALRPDATCHMNSTFLPITNRSTGACASSTSRTRDYGAYLLYQYIGRTYGNTKVRELLAATTTLADALAAIDAHVAGGLKLLWPRYARALWNQVPVTGIRGPAFRDWDGQPAVPALAPDHPTPVNANRGALAEESTGLSRRIANVSTRFYRFTFSDSTTRSLMFRNTFYPLARAGTAVSVLALWQRENGSWAIEDWTLKEWIGFCRDAQSQRLAQLVVVVASGATGSVTQAVAATGPTFRRNNIGCWGFSGSTKRTEIRESWSSGSIVAASTARFTYKPNGTASLQYNDPATGRLRVPIAAPLFRSASWTLNEAYAESGCSYSLAAGATDTSIVLGGLAVGNLVINNFAESLPASLRQQQFGVVGAARGAYLVQVSSQRFGVLGTVSGPQPDCGTSYASAPGIFALSHVEPALAPVITLGGRLRGSYVSSSSPDSIVFEWDLAPLREP
ncbi:MAG TPA: hypothetical protein VLI72_07260 [Methylibium sp.]|nr:hypothetical protein [Methylibium sp.]